MVKKKWPYVYIDIGHNTPSKAASRAASACNCASLACNSVLLACNSASLAAIVSSCASHHVRVSLGTIDTAQ